MYCSSCAKRMRSQRGRRGGPTVYVCESCRGRMATIDSMRRVAGRAQAKELLQGIATLSKASHRDCPSCLQPMQLSGLGEDGEIELDVCRPCGVFWGDEGELAAIRRHAAKERGKRTRRAGARPTPLLPTNTFWPDRWWKYLLILFKLPVETNSGRFQRTPWVTWGLVFVFTAIYFSTAVDLTALVTDWGLHPASAGRHAGADWIVSFFLHADVWHLLSNAYFLLVFGDNVEEHVGHWKMLLLVAVAALVGDIAHILFDPRSDLALIGASGGISGVVALYALLFPRKRLSLLLFWMIPLTLPAVALVVVWLGVQVIGATQQIAGLSSVSFLAHLGGALVGVAAWWFLNPGRARARD